MARVRWGAEVNGWLIEDTGGRVLVAIREMRDTQGRPLAVAVSDEAMVVFRAIGRPYEWATLDDFLGAADHERYWSDTSAQEVLAQFRRDSGWETTPVGIKLFGDQHTVLHIVNDGLFAINSVKTRG